MGTSSKWALAATVATTVACGDASNGVVGEENVEEGCAVVSSKDGHTLTQAELAGLEDPVAKLVLLGKGCPKTFEEVSQKLDTTDPCPSGVGTRFVSERTNLLDKPDEYRTVTSRQCAGRRVYELLLSGAVHAGPGNNIDTAKVSGFAELIGEKRNASDPNKVSGVFNYYAREGNKWMFFGSSEELVSQGYDCNNDGACIPKAVAKHRCAGCHVGGGLVMKELDNPWTFWEASRAPPMPGTVELTKKFPKLFGTRLNGTEMEQAVVRAGNDEWANARLEVVKKKGLRETLRPLFCTLDMNLEIPSLLGTDAGVALPRVLNRHVFIDPIWPSEVHLPAGDKEVDDAEAAINQRVIDSTTNAPFQSNGNVVRRSSIPSVGGLSLTHRDLLVAAGIVDMDLVKDILAVDFTRPTYSKTRCSIVDRIPDLPAADMQPAGIKKAIADALTGAADAAFRASVNDPNDGATHDAAVQTFLEVCKARQSSDAKGFATDLVHYSAQLRKAVRRAGGIIESPEMLATDDLPTTQKAFNGKTCKLE